MALVGNISGSSFIGVSGSVIFADRPNASFPTMPGLDVVFFVSGSSGSLGGTTRGAASFGGDVQISGSLKIGTGSIVITDTFVQIGADNQVRLERSGSVLLLADSTNPTGTPISAFTGSSYWDNFVSGTVSTTGSLVVTGSVTTLDTLTAAVVSASLGFSGSLTKLTDGSSYLVAGANVTITSASNGSVTISSTGGGGGSGDAAATYLVLSATGSLSNERVFTVGTGLSGSDGGSGGNFTIDVDPTVVATLTGAAFTGVATFSAGLSGSLTRLADGASFLVAGDNVTITSASNGAITIAAASGGGGNGDANATYVVLSSTGSLNNERVLTMSTGLTGSDGGAGGNFTVSIDNSVVATVSGTTFTGATKHNAGLSGSLTNLVDGSPYLIAGSNVTITSASNGAITISSVGSGGASFFSSTTAGSVYATGSLALIGGLAISSSAQVGTDVFFFVSGSNNGTAKAVFGGDAVITGSFTPSADNVYNLGTPSLRWANVYTNDLHLRNSRGDWTVIEEETYLSIRNNKTGKLYKFVLEPVEG